MKIVVLETNKPVSLNDYSVLSLVGYAVHFNAWSYSFNKDAKLEDYELWGYRTLCSIYDPHITKWKTYL